MKDKNKTCNNCAYEKNQKMCHLCNKIFFSHWSPGESVKKRMVFQGIKFTRKPHKRKNAFQEYRIKQNMSVRKLSGILECSGRTVQRLSSGIPVDIKTAIKVFERLGISPFDLIFTAELLKKHGLTRDEAVNGRKE